MTKKTKTFQTRKRHKEPKRPNIKSISLSTEACMIWDNQGHLHDWSSELSAFLIGRYGKGVVLETKIMFTKDLLTGYQMYYSREYQKLELEGQGIIKELNECLDDLKLQLKIQQRNAPLISRNVGDDDE